VRFWTEISVTALPVDEDEMDWRPEALSGKLAFSLSQEVIP